MQAWCLLQHKLATAYAESTACALILCIWLILSELDAIRAVCTHRQAFHMHPVDMQATARVDQGAKVTGDMQEQSCSRLQWLH